MLSYQHSYHAGNAADVHKHAALAICLDYLLRKDKAISYIESHAGRGLYDLAAAPARRTGEAAEGVGRLLDRFAADHPYRRAVERCRSAHGPGSYPGSPLIAAGMLRRYDHIQLAELHPAEHRALLAAMPASPNTRVERRDGLEMAKAITPPDPRRGLLLIDPSWEVRADYLAMTRLLPLLHRKWGVGILVLWYPLLPDGRHRPMVRALGEAIPALLRHEVAFAPAREGHGMIGSGLLVANPPWGLENEAENLQHVFAEED